MSRVQQNSSKSPVKEWTWGRGSDPEPLLCIFRLTESESAGLVLILRARSSSLLSPHDSAVEPLQLRRLFCINTHAETTQTKAIKTKYGLKSAALNFLFRSSSILPAYLSPSGDGKDEINFWDQSLIKYRQSPALPQKVTLWSPDEKLEKCPSLSQKSNLFKLGLHDVEHQSGKNSQIIPSHNVIVRIQCTLTVVRVPATKDDCR